MTPVSFQIRPAEYPDLAALKPIWHEFVEYHAALDKRRGYDPGAWPDVLDNFAKSLPGDENVLFVAEAGRQIVGYVYGFIFQNNPGCLPRRIGFIRDLVVSRQFWKKGIGRSLVLSIENWFLEKEVRVVQSFVAFANTSGLNVWKKLSYEEYLVGICKDIGSQ